MMKVTVQDMMEMASCGELVDVGKLLVKSNSMESETRFGQHSHWVSVYGGFEMHEWTSVLREDTLMEMQYSGAPALSLQFMGEGSLLWETQNRDIEQKGRHNYIWNVFEDMRSTVVFRKGVPCASFEVGIGYQLLEKLANDYPELLSPVCEKISKKDFWALNGEKQCTTTCEMMQTISQIKNAWMMGNAAGMYAEAKLRELLALALRREQCLNGGKDCALCCKRKCDIEKIYEARRILLASFAHPPTIVELSRAVGINDFKLKCGFREVFNQTIYECLFEYKMELAVKLLLDTDKSIAEVAGGCGYEYASHFTTAFKRRFGMTPTDFRNARLYG